eukprot:g1185.t1
MSLTKGNSLFVNGQYDLAIKEYDAYISSNDSCAECYVKRASCLIRLERFADALQDATRAIKLANSSSMDLPIAHYHRGVANFWMEEFESARRSFVSGQTLLSTSKGGGICIEKDLKKWIRKCDAELEEEEADEEEISASIEQKDSANKTASEPVPKKRNVPVRYEYYQSSKEVVVTVFQKGLTPSDVAIAFEDKRCKVRLTPPACKGAVVDFDWMLFANILPDKCSWSCNKYKVTLRLEKSDSGIQWASLVTSDRPPPKAAAVSSEPAAATTTTTSKSKAKSTNVYSGSKKDWTKIDKWCEDELEKEKPQGEAALQKLFQDIYAKADPETRRAMNKSYQTSGGTVLSTNWKEVKDEDYEKTKTAPEGMEFRKWDE